MASSSSYWSIKQSKRKKKKIDKIFKKFEKKKTARYVEIIPSGRPKIIMYKKSWNGLKRQIKREI